MKERRLPLFCYLFTITYACINGNCLCGVIPADTEIKHHKQREELSRHGERGKVSGMRVAVSLKFDGTQILTAS